MRKKNKKYIALTSVFLLTAISLLNPAIAADDANELKKISLKKKTDNLVEVNLELTQKLPSPPLLFEKGKNIYFVSLPSTLYGGKRKLDVDALKDNIDNVTVDFVPYKTAKDVGYTRIVIEAKDGTKIVLNDKVGLDKKDLALLILKIFAALAGVGAIGVASYLGVKKINEKRNLKDILDLEDEVYIETAPEDVVENVEKIQVEDDEQILAYIEDAPLDDSIEESTDISIQEKNELLDVTEEIDAVKISSNVENTDAISEENLIENIEEDAAEIFQNDVVEEAIENPETNSVVELENNEDSFGDISGISSAEEMSEDDIQEDFSEPRQDEQYSTVEESYYPSADEIVEDLLNNDEAISQLSETISDELANEDESVSDLLSYIQNDDEKLLENDGVSQEVVEDLLVGDEFLSENEDIQLDTVIDDDSSDNMDDSLIFADDNTISEEENSLDENSDEEETLLDDGIDNDNQEIQEDSLVEADITEDDILPDVDAEQVVVDDENIVQEDNIIEENETQEEQNSDYSSVDISPASGGVMFTPNTLNFTLSENINSNKIELTGDVDAISQEDLNDVENVIQAISNNEDFEVLSEEDLHEFFPENEPIVEETSLDNEETTPFALDSFVADMPTAEEVADAILTNDNEQDRQILDDNDNIFEELMAVEEVPAFSENDEMVVISSDDEPVEYLQEDMAVVQDENTSEENNDDIFDELINEGESISAPEIQNEDEQIFDEISVAEVEQEPELIDNEPIIDTDVSDVIVEDTNDTNEEIISVETVELENVSIEDENILSEVISEDVSNEEESDIDENIEQSAEPTVDEYEQDASGVIEDTQDEMVDVQIDTETFFTQPVDEEVVVSDNFYKDEDDEYDVEVITPEEVVTEEFFKDNEQELDDSEPVLLANEVISDDKQLYLIRHNGQYSLIGTVGEEVFVLNKFEEPPIKENILLKLNEKRDNADIYIVKVGLWRALICVDTNSMENILTLS